MTAGLHVPVIAGELVDDVGNRSGVSLRQYGPKGSKVVVISGFTSISSVVGRAHSPAIGVNV